MSPKLSKTCVLCLVRSEVEIRPSLSHFRVPGLRCSSGRSRDPRCICTFTLLTNHLAVVKVKLALSLLTCHTVSWQTRVTCVVVVAVAATWHCFFGLIRPELNSHPYFATKVLIDLFCIVAFRLGLI